LSTSYGYPAKFLTDNAAVFSGTPRKGRVVLESELDRLGSETNHGASSSDRSPRLYDGHGSSFVLSETGVGMKEVFLTRPSWSPDDLLETSPLH
jgi:hypothetical protein